jgi:steroid delta-isomerase-like uncharacterized protein
MTDFMRVAAAYFEAWNQHDPGRIVASFADGGTYMDPASGGALKGAAIGHYASGLFTAFPDLAFEVVSCGPIGEGMIAAQWLMRGTNTGSMSGGPPTGKSIALPGADFITIEGSKIRSVRGYFDMKELGHQLGF